MTIAYDQDGEFLSAHIDVIIRPPFEQAPTPGYAVRMLVDTGAVMAHVDDGVPFALGIRPVGQETAEGFGGKFPVMVYTLSLELHVPGKPAMYLPAVKVYATNRRRHVLGMNVLRNFPATFDGPALELRL